MSPPRPRVTGPRSAAFILVLGAFAFWAVGAPARGMAGVQEPGPKLPPGITALKDQGGSGARYRPRFDWWSETEVRVYPFIVAATDDGRQIVLHVSRVARSRLGISTIDFLVDGKPSRFEFKKAAIDRSGCLPDEWVNLHNQEDLIRAIPESQETRVVLQGKRARAEYVLTPADHLAFRRVVDLYDAPTLPSVPDAFPGKGEKEAPGATWPVPVKRVNPQFPHAAKGMRSAGRVVLLALITRDGRTEVLDILESTAPYCGFEDAAIQAIRMWRYTPATKDSEPVDVYFTIVVEFSSR